MLKKIYIKSGLKLFLLKLKWRRKNKHNFTHVGNLFDINKVRVGKGTYGALNVMTYGNPNEKLEIGSFCSIGAETFFLLGGEHKSKCITTYPFKHRYTNNKGEALSKGEIIIQDDVWIGFRSTIMSGVTIGQGAIVAAGAVVTQNIPPYAIVGGVPAKVIRYRFEQGLIDELLNVDYQKLTTEKIMEHINELYEELTDINQLEWLPKKEK